VIADFCTTVGTGLNPSEVPGFVPLVEKTLRPICVHLDYHGEDLVVGINDKVEVEILAGLKTAPEQFLVGEFNPRPVDRRELPPDGLRRAGIDLLCRHGPAARPQEVEGFGQGCVGGTVGQLFSQQVCSHTTDDLLAFHVQDQPLRLGGGDSVWVSRVVCVGGGDDKAGSALRRARLRSVGCLGCQSVTGLTDGWVQGGCG
jgi:hypothetical protein